MVEGDDIEALGEVGGIRVDDVLEILGEALIQGIKVHPAVDHSQKPEKLVRGKVFNDLLL